MDRSLLEIVAQLADATRAAVWGGTRREVEFFSPRWIQYAGGTAEGWLARGWESAIHEDDRARCTIAWSEALNHRATGDIEARIQTGAGDYRWHRIRFVLGSEHTWFGIAVDLGEPHQHAGEVVSAWARERSARADAEQASQLKDRFFAAVSHELRAPIAALLLWERMLRGSELDAANTTRALDAIHHSALAQARLVDDLLDVARASAGKLAVRLAPVDLAAILERAIEEKRPAIAEKQLVLDVEIANDTGNVEGDEARLLQVVGNLLDNAIKFTPARGRIGLSARRANGDVIVEVTDNGRGIEPALLERVFDVFSQLEEDSDHAAGLGLGLAIARELVALHGGTLEAHSAGIGEGTRFALRLPMTKRDVAPARRSNAEALRGVSLLVVDDDQRVLGALEILLARAGATVRCATSVADAWDMLATDAPDVVLSDIAMPVASGYELVHRMRADATFARVPAIALTAHAAGNDARRSLAEGFDAHVSKPVDLESLVATIARLARH